MPDREVGDAWKENGLSYRVVDGWWDDNEPFHHYIALDPFVVDGIRYKFPPDRRTPGMFMSLKGNT